MGSSGSKDVQQNANFNLAEYNQRVANSGVYSQNPMNLSQQNQYYFQQSGMNHKPAKIQEFNVNKISLDYSIVKNSLSISKENDKIVINLKYTAKKPGELKILFMVTQNQQYDTGIPILQSKEQLVQSINVTNSQFSITRHIKVHPNLINSLNLERKNKQGFYPFVLILGNQTQKLYTYARTVNNYKDTVIIKQKIENQGRAFFLHHVFGLAKDSDQRLCIICFSEQSDVSIFPCGHLCLCFSCCGELMRTSSTCPICRKNIQSYQRIKGVSDKKQ